MKTLAEIYLPAEQSLIDQLYEKMRAHIKENKKLPYMDSDNNPKEECLEYFITTDSEISFNKRGSKKSKDKVTVKELKNSLKLLFRTEEELTKAGFNKAFGKTKFVESPLYLFLNITADEIRNRRIVGQEITHQTFGKGIISRMELQKDSVWLKCGEENKMLAMDYVTLNDHDEEKLKNILSMSK